MNPSLSPVIIPVFIPHAGCPHRCVFCNQRAITGKKKVALNANLVENAMALYDDSDNHHSRAVQIAFYGGNFLGLPEDTIRAMLGAAQYFISIGKIDGIRFSTRPDTINEDRVALIKKYAVETVEIGAQSMSNRVLGASHRGHDASQTAAAVSLLKANGFETGVQMMIGLPGDSDRTVLLSGEAIAALTPDFVRIYPTVVLAGSDLEKWYRSGRYTPLSLDRAVALTKDLWTIFNQAGIRVVRMGLPATDELQNGTSLAGPFHPAFGHLVYEALIFDTIVNSYKKAESNDVVDIHVHPRNFSKVTGLNSGNRERLATYYTPNPVHLIPDKTVPIDQLIVNRQPCHLYGINSAYPLDGVKT